MNILKKLWRGEVLLGLTFWAYGVGGNILLGILFVFILTASPSFAGIIPFLAFGLIKVFFLVFMSVAIFRSADNYVGNRLWSVLAKLAVIFGYLQFIASLGRLGSGFQG